MLKINLNSIKETFCTYSIAFVVAILLSNPTFASPSKEEIQKKCERVQGLAFDVMKARQAGASASEMMQVSRLPIVDIIVKLAFMTPRMLVDESKHEAAVDFSNKLYMDCLKAHD